MNAPIKAPKRIIKAGNHLNPKITNTGAAQAPEIPQPKPKKVPPTNVLTTPLFLALELFYSHLYL
jgi:hypothetical protein